MRYLPVLAALFAASLCSCTEVQTPNEDSLTFELQRTQAGDLEYCGDDGDCTIVENPAACATLIIIVNNVNGETCETCESADGNVVYQTCDETAVSCSVVTTPDPDCVVCAHVGGDVIYSTCTVDRPDYCVDWTSDDGQTQCQSCWDSTGELILEECTNSCDLVDCMAVECPEGTVARNFPGDCCDVCVPVEPEYCDSDYDCKPGDRCAPQAGIEECGCWTDCNDEGECWDICADCDPRGICEPDPTACNANYDCEPGHACVDGSCQPQPEPSCYSDGDCAENQFCAFFNGGGCEGDCDPDGFCNFSCPAVEVGVCTFLPDPQGECWSDEDCAPQDYCLFSDVDYACDCFVACEPSEDGEEPDCEEICPPCAAPAEIGMCLPRDPICPDYAQPDPDACAGEWQFNGYDDMGCRLPPACVCADGTVAADLTCELDCSTVLCAAVVMECEDGYTLSYENSCCGECVPYPDPGYNCGEDPCADPSDYCQEQCNEPGPGYNCGEDPCADPTDYCQEQCDYGDDGEANP